MNIEEWILRPWCLLRRDEGRTLHSAIREAIRQAIENARREVELLDFLSSMAYFCFTLDFDCGMITRELRLGADHRVDFLIAQDGFSRGNKYILIEAESPAEKPYTQGGNPSSRLNHALQQIRDWRRWIQMNRDEAERLFPSSLWSYGIEAAFEYEILIGRTQDFQNFSPKIIQLARENDVQINPFDHLLHNFDRKDFYRTFVTQAGQIKSAHPQTVRNIIASPFRMTSIDTEYREIIRHATHRYHLTVDIARAQAERACFNDYLKPFDDMVFKLFDDQREKLGCSVSFLYFMDD